MNKVLKIRPVIKKNHRSYKIDLYVLAPFSCYMTREEMRSYMIAGYSLEVDLSNFNSKNKSKREISEKDILLRILRSFEKFNKEEDINLLNRIIRGGGFTNYILELERSIGGK